MKRNSRTKKRGGVFTSLFSKKEKKQQEQQEKQPCDYFDQITMAYKKGSEISSITGSFINQIQSLQKKCKNTSHEEEINKMLNKLIEKKKKEDETEQNKYLNSKTFNHGRVADPLTNKWINENSTTTGGKYKKRSRKTKKTKTSKKK
jgi:hypothetical protein